MASPRDNALVPSAEDFRADSLRGMPGFFRIGQTTTGQWWLLDPLGHAFFCKAVAGVNRSGRIGGRVPQASAYGRTMGEQHGADAHGFMRAAIGRMRAWHFNTLGAWAEPTLAEQGMYYTEVLGLGRCGPVIHSGAALLPDVFDPAWREAAAVQAKALCEPHRGSRELLGYFTDHELGWAQPSEDNEEMRAGAPERPSLLQICLSLEPSFRAYHAAWEFVLATRRGELTRLAEDWRVDLPNKETLRQLTQSEVALTSPGYLRDQQIFSREFARRYFATCAAVVREYAPEHLILGCRFAVTPGAAVLAECVYPNVDALSVRPSGLAWEKTVQSCYAARSMPVLLVDAQWTREAFWSGQQPRESSALTSVERMLKRGRVVFTRVFSHRAVLGYEWSRWADEELDEAPFGRGLVRTDDREAREHTELLTELNTHAERVRVRSR